jgi:hypothetical protein
VMATFGGFSTGSEGGTCVVVSTGVRAILNTGILPFRSRIARMRGEGANVRGVIRSITDTWTEFGLRKKKFNVGLEGRS